jgi:phenylalanyl-tRNA synthetase alpha chain
MGTIHPVSQVMEELTAIFADMGFAVAEGPQVESDWYNFDALNIPPEHPARQEHDTFFMHRAAGDDRPPHVLRTHTSPVQIRAMTEKGAPIRVIAPAASTGWTWTRPTPRCSIRSKALPSTATSAWPT